MSQILKYIIDDTRPFTTKKRDKDDKYDVFYDITKKYDANLVGPKLNKE
jgi:hypothetical protein